MKNIHEQTLLQICDIIRLCQKAAEAEYIKEKFGDSPPFELLIDKQEKIRVELRKENTNHNEPHIHIIHSDKIDASVSIRTFEVLAGKLDKKTRKLLIPKLQSKQEELLEIWRQLNDENNSIEAHKLISILF